ncbi:MAG TPA: hypothetical protein VGZ69_04225 [Candidatus Rhabdochlamydia sp.]|jgi:hypothetical protein|nr:hypothetical protein [Candidatus Rhabdochlamydia sp.]
MFLRALFYRMGFLFPSFERALIEERVFSTIKYRNIEWEKYLSNLGSKKEVATHFSKWQERLHSYAQIMEKFIPTLYLDAKEQNWDTLAKTLYDLTING